MRRWRWQRVEEALVPVLAVLIALALGVLLIVWAGKSPVLAYRALLTSTVGSVGSFGETLVNVTPLILTGLAVAFAFRCGLFNIGGEGQYLVAQMATAYAGYSLCGIPALLHIPLVLLVGAAAGGLWAALPGYLKARLGVHEVINTIMMNYIALYLTHYLVIGPLKEPGPLPVTPAIAQSARLPQFLPPSRLHLGFFVALACAWLVYQLLWRTTVGYEIRAVGFNRTAAEYGGIRVGRSVVLAMTISGALAGLAGAVQVSGLQYRFFDAFTFVGYGFEGIAVALLGKNHPLGVIMAAFLFGALSRGAILMQSMADIPKEIIGIIQATVIFLVAADQIVRALLRWRRRRGVVTGAE